MKIEKTSKKKPIIAVAQIKYFDISYSNNLAKLKKFIKKAKKRNADIICFPESCIHRSKVLKKDDKFIKELKEECKKNSIWCIITEDLKLKDKSHNTSILIDRQGEIKGYYKKINLYGDGEKITPGTRINTFKTDFGKIGIVICWDLAFPKLFQRLKRAGTQIVFCPSLWQYEPTAHDKNPKKRETKILRSLILSRAFENIFFVAFCNPVIKSKYQVSYSAIASPHKILNEIINKEGLITAKIDLSKIKKYEKIYRN